MELKNNELKQDFINVFPALLKEIESDVNKLAVSKAVDFDLDFPYAIDVEDMSYFYAFESDRDSDFNILLKGLNDISRNYHY